MKKLKQILIRAWWFYIVGAFRLLASRDFYRPNVERCYWCGYDDGNFLEWEKKIYDGGKTYVPGEPDQYWYEGMIICPRCGIHMPYSDV